MKLKCEKHTLFAICLLQHMMAWSTAGMLGNVDNEQKLQTVYNNILLSNMTKANIQQTN